MIIIKIKNPTDREKDIILRMTENTHNFAICCGIPNWYLFYSYPLNQLGGLYKKLLMEMKGEVAVAEIDISNLNFKEL